ncbi:MAG: hypothetical protein HY908_01825 [Myxococcales bacterium]|nr:hypothetical protein [Myxococcales bacterium]
MRTRTQLVAALFGLALALLGPTAAAQEPGPAPRADGSAPEPARPAPAEVDRVVVRWWVRGRPETPRFIFARELAFESRLEALADGVVPAPGLEVPYADKHVRAAIQRHVAESMLADLQQDAEVAPANEAERIAAAARIAHDAEAARGLLERRIGDRPGQGRSRLAEALVAEGLTGPELDVMLRRQARAGIYLDERVAPMLEPDEAELAEVHRRGDTPYTDVPFEAARADVKNWLVATRLATALERYFRSARQRVEVEIVRAAP